MNSISPKILTDLEIHNKVIPHIDKTITIYGKAKFRDLFNIMYNNEQNLLRRRQIIQSILKKQKNVKKITIQLNKIKKYEDTVRWLFGTIGKEYKDLYFKREYFNTQDLLSTKNFLKTYSPSFIIIIYLLIFVVLKYYGLSIDIKSYIMGIYESYKMFIISILYLFMENINLISLLTNMFATFYVLYQLYTIYNSFDSSVVHYYKCSDFNKHINKIRNLINCVKEIYRLDKFFTIEKKLISDDIHEMDELYNDSKINKIGYNLLLKRDSQTHESKFNKMLQYIGLVDAFISISKLVMYHGYTFPLYDFTKESGPYINATGLWSPYINYSEQVKNNCELGSPNTIILTGPNTSGKSTYIRNVMLSILLSQTIGVTCCDYLQYTPFTHLFTYLDIPNVSRDKESLFEAELLRCMEYCTILEQLNENEYTFTILDELFTATNPKEGIASSFSVCEYLGKFKNSLNILTTHFMELTKLGYDQPKNFKNMKFTIIENPDGSFLRPYTLETGRSDQHIAIKLLKNKGYNNYIVDRAIEKLKEL
jgi:DNA mismatch repair ATPase MutS